MLANSFNQSGPDVTIYHARKAFTRAFTESFVFSPSQQEQQQQPLFTLFWYRKKKGGKETNYRKQNNGRFIVIYIYKFVN